MERARELIAAAPGCRLVDDLKNKKYPMPLDTSDQIRCSWGGYGMT